ncbi:MAG: hypothetical protein WAV73_04995 [Candidatus Moraniibacteriota bacterium]
MPQVKCKICSKEFYAKPNWVKLGWGKYCSRKCKHEAAKTGREINCAICNKKTYKTQKALKGSKSNKYFCSKSCQTVWRNSVIFVGKNHTNWKDGKFTYRTIIARSDVPKVCKLCGEEDDRVLLVHHLDVNNKNNELKNLTWLCHNCHFLVHHYIEERKKLAVKIIK